MAPLPVWVFLRRSMCITWVWGDDKGTTMSDHTPIKRAPVNTAVVLQGGPDALRHVPAQAVTPLAVIAQMYGYFSD